MAIELVGRRRRVDLDRDTWCLILWLAQEHGWRPAGSRPPSLRALKSQHPAWTDARLRSEERWLNREWDGDYTTNENGRIADDDAAALAHALERALEEARQVGKQDRRPWTSVPEVVRLLTSGGAQIR